MSEWQFESTSVEETQRLAGALVGALNSRGVIGLVGDLGMGKTHFVQGSRETGWSWNAQWPTARP